MSPNYDHMLPFQGCKGAMGLPGGPTVVGVPGLRSERRARTTREVEMVGVPELPIWDTHYLGPYCGSMAPRSK